nr:BON domain-containing protein [Paraburkholderia sp. Ac-20347]
MLAKSVRRALVKVKGLDSTNVVVLAKNGDIVVGGSVPDSSQIPLAISTAQGVADVKSVKNALTIKRR